MKHLTEAKLLITIYMHLNHNAFLFRKYVIVQNPSKTRYKCTQTRQEELHHIIQTKFYFFMLMWQILTNGP